MQTNKMPLQAGGVQLNTRALVVAIVGLVTLVYGLYSWSGSSSKDKPAAGSNSLTMFHNWKSMDFVDIPQNIVDLSSKVKIRERLLTFEYEDKKGDIYVQEVEEPKFDKKVPVLLLHGAAFTSQNWVDLGTLRKIGAMGHRVLAIDLPGWGKSKNYGKLVDKGGFLAKFIHQEKLHKPVIISPSMSGSFSIPYIMEKKPVECTDRIRGFVPVAPVGTEAYTHDRWHRCESPVMIVYGTKDTTLGLQSLGNLRNMPNSEICPLEGAKHPAYLDEPDKWHRLLYNFLLAVEREAV